MTFLPYLLYNEQTRPSWTKTTGFTNWSKLCPQMLLHLVNAMTMPALKMQIHMIQHLCFLGTSFHKMKHNQHLKGGWETMLWQVFKKLNMIFSHASMMHDVYVQWIASISEALLHPPSKAGIIPNLVMQQKLFPKSHFDGLVPWLQKCTQSMCTQIIQRLAIILWV